MQPESQIGKYGAIMNGVRECCIGTCLVGDVSC